MNNTFWAGKSVFLTGHTGFKGAWLALWLQRLGARVYGYALAPQDVPNLFSVVNVAQGLANNTIGDIRDAAALSAAMAVAKPEIVLHLAAQALVRKSYANPAETYSTNVMGTVNLFDAVRRVGSVRAVVNVTTDKCYENREWIWPYRENEPMGGYDPYSSSKGCVELVTAAYRQSFFQSEGVALASARAGNVIGGGDWAADRIIPDLLRAADAGFTLRVRSPNAVRPWQHVLEPLSGYLQLAEQLYLHGQQFAEAWNFGPQEVDAKSVRWIVERMQALLPGVTWEQESAEQPHEATYLRLDSSKASARLQWQPRWHLDTALEKIAQWHAGWRRGTDMRVISLAEIAAYEASATID